MGGNYSLGKPGVGLYLDARPRVAARVLVIDTTTPGFAATIYGAQHAAEPRHVLQRRPDGLDPARAVGVGRPAREHPPQRRALPLLPDLDHPAAAGKQSASLNEVTLYVAPVRSRRAESVDRAAPGER